MKILVEENYAENSRFLELYEGLLAAAKKKQESVEVFKRSNDLPKDCKIVILICQSLKWVTEEIVALNKKGIHPLIFGFQYLDTMCEYSSLAPNYTKAAYRLTKALLSKNAGKTAVLGYNNDSLPDRLKELGIRYALNEKGEEYRVYKNNGDIIDCLNRFSDNCEDIQNIVCCNDNVAIKLYTEYSFLLENRKMCSCGGLKLSEFFENRYPVCKINYKTAAQQLARLYFYLKKEEEIYSTVMTFDMQLSGILESKEIFDRSKIETSTEAINFYGDQSIQNVERLNRMLSQADETDLKILRKLLENKTYEDIAEETYLATNTVKWRVKKMLDTVGVKTRKDLTELLKENRLKF